MAIELAVSRAITRIHALERALHESGPWYVRAESFMVPAVREIADQGVRFRARIPARVSDLAELCLRDEVLLTIGDVQGGRHGQEMLYELSLGVAAESVA